MSSASLARRIVTRLPFLLKEDKLSTHSAETKTKTPFRMAWNRFIRHRLACVSAGILVLFAITALSAPLIGDGLGLHPEEQNIHSRYLPPFSQATLSTSEQESRIEVFGELNPEIVTNLANAIRSGSLIVGEGIADELSEDLDALFYIWEQKADNPAIPSALGAATLVGKEKIFELFNSFSKFHILGTDELGRDVLIRLIYGTRVSIGVGLLVAFFAALIGLFIGTLAGFFGGFVDNILMRTTDALMAIPLLPVLIVLAAIDLHKVPVISYFVTVDFESIAKLVFILCIFSWMTVARVVRGCILSIREMEYIAAARSIGAGNLRIILLHIVPNVIAPLLVAVTLNVGTAIIIEAALSFLGLGIQAPTPSWGNMLFNAQELIFEAPWLAVMPGTLIFFVVVSFNFLGDGLQYAIDPKQ